MADHAHAHSHGHDEAGHGHGGVGKYIMVFFALCALTAVSFIVGSNEYLRENAPKTMWAAMMAVSCAKALLVILFFMHILWEANWKYVLTVPASLMSIFMMLMLIPDIGRRTLKYSEERWLYAAEPEVNPADEAEGDDHKDNHDRDHAQPAKGGHGEHN
jgi:cytochrome c oxidase subunit 4